MDLHTATTWAADRKNAVLITLRKDGRAQSSDIAYAVAGERFLISVTADRAKTANMRRDPRVVLHITEPDSWSYVAFDGTVELSPVATEPHDVTCDLLVDYFERVAGEAHPDWEEYRQAMVMERRLVASFVPTSAVGQVR
jgi:PPOX class probable F420-dependent enzyme